MQKVSNWNKPIVEATISPDGHAIAFSSPINNVLQVFVMLTSGGSPLQLTNDEGNKFVSSFSADGTKVYYIVEFGREETWAVQPLEENLNLLLPGLMQYRQLTPNTCITLELRKGIKSLEAKKRGSTKKACLSLRKIWPQA